MFLLLCLIKIELPIDGPTGNKSKLVPVTTKAIHVVAAGRFYNTVNLVIFACFNFREFPILGLFTKFRIRDFSFVLRGAIIKINFARFLNSRIYPPREIREN